MKINKNQGEVLSECSETGSKDSVPKTKMRKEGKEKGRKGKKKGKEKGKKKRGRPKKIAGVFFGTRKVSGNIMNK